jgi:hypothetical protein
MATRDEHQAAEDSPFLRDCLGERFVMGVVLHTGPHAVRIGDRLWALPIEALWSV